MTEALNSFRKLLQSKHKIAADWKKLRGRLVVGWSSVYTPEEIIYAADILPVRVLTGPSEARLADRYLPGNVCSFTRSCLESALSGDYSYLDGYVTSNSCDNLNKMYDLWRHCIKIPYTYFINTPHKNTLKTREFFRTELERFKNSLEKAFRTEVDDEKLVEAVKTYNENRRLLGEVYKMRGEDPPLISGVEALEIVLSSMVTPKKTHSEMLTQLLNEAGGYKGKNGGVRLLVSGSILDNTQLLKLAESVGGVVVADDLSTGSRYFSNQVSLDHDPLRAISISYLNRTPSPFMLHSKERFKHVERLVRDANVEAALVYTVRFCDVHLFDVPPLIQKLKQLGVPALHLEWDHSMSGFAQLKTRLEAFIEMVRGVA